MQPQEQGQGESVGQEKKERSTGIEQRRLQAGPLGKATGQQRVPQRQLPGPEAGLEESDLGLENQGNIAVVEDLEPEQEGCQQQRRQGDQQQQRRDIRP